MSGPLFEHYKAALRRGHVALLAGSLDEALEAYRAASRLVPERALPLASQGTVLHRLGRWPEAAEAFDRALRLSPDDEAAVRARATAREERGLRSGAAADYERLAFILDVAGRGEAAAEAARKADALEPTPARSALVARLGTTVGRTAEVAEDGSTAGSAGDAEPAAEIETLAEPEPLGAIEAIGAGGGVPEIDAEIELELAMAAAAERAATLAAEELVAPVAAEELAATVAAEELAAAAVLPTADESVALPTTDDPDAPKTWPAIDLPSPPPAPIVGPPPDPEVLLAEALALIEAGLLQEARDRMLTSVLVHRAAGRADAALDVCLQLLTIAPGDPQVHLAIANLQLDRGWTALATEKIELLIRLTSLTGDTQAEADVHGLASERLRDTPIPAASR